MGQIWTMGELLVEIMREKLDEGLSECSTFLGPFPSGAPAIFIDTVARLGHRAGIIGAVGDDDFGSCILKRLVEDGVDCSYIRNLPGTTATAFVTYFKDSSRKYIFHVDNTPAVQAKYEWMQNIEDISYFHVMGSSLMASDDLKNQIFLAVDSLWEKGTEITFDPNIRKELLGTRKLDDVIGPVLDKTSILFPGLQELSLMSGKRDIEAAISKLFDNRNLKLIVLKLGAKGCTIYSRNAEISIPAYKVIERDPTGAGDCFDAGFLCGLLEQHNLEQSAKIASAVGAINASAFGPMEGKINRMNVAKMTGIKL